MKDAPTPSFSGRTQGRRVPVYVGRGILDQLGRIIVPQEQSQPLEIVTDTTVDRILGRSVWAALRQVGWRVHRTVLPPGERSKNARTVSRLQEQWFGNGCDRATPVVALGGGTVGDTVGFAAATFLRGLPLWQVPTTVLAQVDASLGGKVGINHSRGKNLIGCFYQPRGIVIDPAVLSTLPERELRSGLAEVVKYGIIADHRLFEICERRLPGWLQDKSVPADIIGRCARIKVRIVAIDETDTGLRRILNFGHTLGHALERWGRYRRLRHGEAVTLGMLAAGWISWQRGFWSGDDFQRLGRLCRMLKPTRPLAAFDAREIMMHLKVDKKRARGRDHWVLPLAIGRVNVYDDVTDREIRRALSYVGHWFSNRE